MFWEEFMKNFEKSKTMKTENHSGNLNERTWCPVIMGVWINFKWNQFMNEFVRIVLVNLNSEILQLGAQ